MSSPLLLQMHKLYAGSSDDAVGVVSCLRGQYVSRRVEKVLSGKNVSSLQARMCGVDAWQKETQAALGRGRMHPISTGDALFIFFWLRTRMK